MEISANKSIGVRLHCPRCGEQITVTLDLPVPIAFPLEELSLTILPTPDEDIRFEVREEQDESPE